MPNSVRPHRQQPTRLHHPWDSPGKNTGVGCHFLLQCVKVKLLSLVRLFVTPWTTAYQAPPSTGFSRQEYWSGMPLLSPCNTLVGSEYCLLSLLGDSNFTSHRLRTSEVAQSCLTLWDPRDYSLPDSSIQGILQARVPEWVAISCSRGSSQLRDQTHVSHIAGRRFTI